MNSVEVDELWSLDPEVSAQLGKIYGLIFLFKWDGRKETQSQALIREFGCSGAQETGFQRNLYQILTKIKISSNFLLYRKCNRKGTLIDV